MSEAVLSHMIEQELGEDREHPLELRGYREHPPVQPGGLDLGAVWPDEVAGARGGVSRVRRRKARGGHDREARDRVAPGCISTELVDAVTENALGRSGGSGHRAPWVGSDDPMR